MTCPNSFETVARRRSNERSTFLAGAPGLARAIIARWDQPLAPSNRMPQRKHCSVPSFVLCGLLLGYRYDSWHRWYMSAMTCWRGSRKRSDARRLIWWSGLTLSWKQAVG